MTAPTKKQIDEEIAALLKQSDLTPEQAREEVLARYDLTEEDVSDGS